METTLCATARHPLNGRVPDSLQHILSRQRRAGPYPAHGGGLRWEGARRGRGPKGGNGAVIGGGGEGGGKRGGGWGGGGGRGEGRTLWFLMASATSASANISSSSTRPWSWTACLRRDEDNPAEERDGRGGTRTELSRCRRRDRRRGDKRGDTCHRTEEGQEEGRRGDTNQTGPLVTPCMRVHLVWRGYAAAAAAVAAGAGGCCSCSCCC